MRSHILDSRNNTKFQFSAALHRYIEKLQNEDLHDLEQKRELQLQIQKEIEILNNQQQLQKEKRMQEDKMQDMQVHSRNIWVAWLAFSTLL